MKKLMSKILIIFIMIIMLFEFTFSNNVVFAVIGLNNVESATPEKSKITKTINAITNLLGGVVAILYTIKRLEIIGITWILDEVIGKFVAASCGVTYGNVWDAITPFDIFFNKFVLLDINFFDMSTGSGTINAIRNSVAKWFYIVRLIAVVILLCVLIYVGIRMAISTVADEKANCKKMLVDWVASLLLVFILQYIIIFTVYTNNAIVKFLKVATEETLAEFMSDVALKAIFGLGIISVVATAVYTIMVFQTLMFLVAYIQRMLKIGFLIIISPLISITYSIDKMGDGKAQALNAWFKEFVYTILIQPFHCIMYIAYIGIAKELMNKSHFMGLFSAEYDMITNGVLVILCLLFINEGEKIIRKIFNFKDDDKLTSVMAGAAFGMMAVKNAKKIGTATAKTVNTAKSMSSRFQSKLSNDMEKYRIPDRLNSLQNKITNSNFAQKISNSSFGKSASKITGNAKKLAGNINAKGSKRLQQFKSTKAFRGAKSLGQKTQNSIQKLDKSTKKYRKIAGRVLRRTTPGSMAAIGALASLAFGDSALNALAAGDAMNSGTESFLQASEGNLTTDGADVVSQEFHSRNSEYEKISNDFTTKNKELKACNKKIDKYAKRLSSSSDPDMPKTIKDFERTMDFIDKNSKSVSASDRKRARSLKKKLQGFEGGALWRELEKRKKLEQERTALEAQKQAAKARMTTDKNQSTAQILTDLKSNGREEQIKSAQASITQALIELKILNKAGSTGNIANIDLEEDEMADIKQESIIIADMLQRSIIGTGCDINPEEYAKTNHGPMSQNLGVAIRELQFQLRAAEYNKIRGNATEVGVDEKRFEQRVIDKIDDIPGFDD